MCANQCWGFGKSSCVFDLLLEPDKAGTWWSLTTKGKISRGVLVSVKGEGGLGEEKMAQPRMGQDLFMSA